MSPSSNQDKALAASKQLPQHTHIHEPQQQASKQTAKQQAANQMCNQDQNVRTTSTSKIAQTATTKPTANMSQLESKLEANLHSAASEGKVELVRLLLRCGADINAQDKQFGNTALHQASWNGFSQTVQVLCKHRANTSIKNKALFTPLHMACQQGHNQTARLLLMANAKTEAKNSYGDTPLHTAARYGHAGVARILLSAKCNPNQVNKNHDTPLHIAAAMGRRKLTKIFMQQGAEPAIKNKQNETAMDIALRKDLIDIQELIANPPPMKHKSSLLNRNKNNECPMEDEISNKLETCKSFSSSKRKLLNSTTTSGRCQLINKSTSYQRMVDIVGESSNLNIATTNNQWANSKRFLERRRGRHAHKSSDDQSSDLDRRLTRLTLRTSNHAHQHSAARDSRTRETNKHHHSSRRSNKQNNKSTKRSFNKELPEKDDEDDVVNDDDDDDDDDDQVEEFEHHEHHCRDESNEIAVDVPGEVRLIGSQERRHHDSKTNAASKLVTSRSAYSQSVHSLYNNNNNNNNSYNSNNNNNNQRGFNGNGLLAKSSRISEVPPRATLLTISGGGSGADLHLLASRQPNGCRSRRPHSALGEAIGKSPKLEEACLPDAKLEPQMVSVDQGYPVGDRKEVKQRESPTGSSRSSLSKSRGRLIVKRKPTATIGKNNRRPNLGSCVGKLSLLKLREMVNKRAQRNRKLQPQMKSGDDVEKKSPEIEEPISKEDSVAAKEAVSTSTGGRRAERLQHQHQQHQPPANIAPNGSQLILTKPMAPLSDDTQLYAIPKKSLKNGATAAAAAKRNQELQQANQQQQVATNSTGLREALDAAQKAADDAKKPEVVAGPALVASELKSCSSSSSCSDEAGITRATPPSSSSAIASSSDECVDSMGATSGAGKRPAVVGVHGTQDFYNVSPGYSVIKEDHHNHHHHHHQLSEEMDEDEEDFGSDQEQPCLCGHDEEQPAMTTTTTTYGQQRQVATERDTSSDTRSGLPNSTGYYAYSPVVQSSTEATSSAQVIRQSQSNNAKPANAKSWLKSKFCLAGSTSVQETLQRETNESQQQDQRGPERKPEMISIETKQQQQRQQTQSLALIVNEQLKHEHERSWPTGGGNSLADQDHQMISKQLIRPKSALSATSADLIAAQRSLAAAAAAKVRRDRLAKMTSGGSDFEPDERDDISASRESVLTVKTSGVIPYWPSSAASSHFSQQLSVNSGQPPLVVANGRIIQTNYHQNYLSSHRSGTNSVGMSDSSPSNNGADSDNSISQTTTGSGSEARFGMLEEKDDKQASTKQPSSALGILSRILLNNNNNNSKKLNPSPRTDKSNESSGGSSTLKAVNSSAGSSCSGLESGSSMSSSSLSSPAISNEGSNSHKLEQLESRSRCPIVMSSSNDSSSSGCERAIDSANIAARLPPKCVLKGHLAELDHRKPSNPMPDHPAPATKLNLARVSSYTQLSTMDCAGSSGTPPTSLTPFTNLHPQNGPRFYGRNEKEAHGEEDHLLKHHQSYLRSSSKFAASNGGGGGGVGFGDPLSVKLLQPYQQQRHQRSQEQGHRQHLSSNHDLGFAMLNGSQLDPWPESSACASHGHNQKAFHDQALLSYTSSLGCSGASVPAHALATQDPFPPGDCPRVSVVVPKLAARYQQPSNDNSSSLTSYSHDNFSQRHHLQESFLYSPFHHHHQHQFESHHFNSATPSARMFAGHQIYANGPEVASRPRPKSSLGGLYPTNKQQQYYHHNYPVEAYGEENFIYATDRMAAAYHSKHSELTVMPTTSDANLRQAASANFTKRAPSKSLVQLNGSSNNNTPQATSLSSEVTKTTCANKTKVIVNAGLDSYHHQANSNATPSANGICKANNNNNNNNNESVTLL